MTRTIRLQYRVIKLLPLLPSLDNIQYMKNLQELKDNYDRNTLKTIVVSKKNYDKLKTLGFATESFNTVISRLLAKLEEEK
jgi:hypothetical protein